MFWLVHREFIKKIVRSSSSFDHLLPSPQEGSAQLDRPPYHWQVNHQQGVKQVLASQLTEFNKSDFCLTVQTTANHPKVWSLPTSVYHHTSMCAAIARITTLNVWNWKNWSTTGSPALVLGPNIIFQCRFISARALVVGTLQLCFWDVSTSWSWPRLCVPIDSRRSTRSVGAKLDTNNSKLWCYDMRSGRPLSPCIFGRW